MIDALLSRETQALELRDTDRVLARLVGAVLSAARAGSEDLADAHVVAAAVEAGGGIILTVDEADLKRLADPYRTNVLEQLSSRLRHSAANKTWRRTLITVRALEGRPARKLRQFRFPTLRGRPSIRRRRRRAQGC